MSIVILNKICKLIVDCPHTTAKDEGKGFPLVRTPNIGRGRLVYAGMHRVSEEVYNKRNARAIPQEDDLIFAREATAGNVALIQKGERVCLGQRTVLIRPDKNVVSPAFLTYCLLAPQQQHNLLCSANGATVAHVNLPIIRNLKIDLPDLAVQKRIAEVLSRYDTLIENYRKQIKLLEEAAQCLYKEWFVDFRFPGHEKTKIVDGVPEGWEKKALSKILSSDIGGGWGKDSPVGTYDIGGHVIRGTDISQIENGNMDVPYRYHTKSNLKERRLVEGDIVFEVSGGSAKEPVGRTLFITNDLLKSFGPNTICASFCKKMSFLSIKEAVIAYNAIRYYRGIGFLHKYEKDSAGKIINYNWKGFLNEFEILLPNEHIKNIIATSFYNIIKTEYKLRHQIRLLSEARDLLLPKLMSGEITL